MLHETGELQGVVDLEQGVPMVRQAYQAEGPRPERYELLGVQEYWVVDPKRHEARICHRSGQRLRQAAELTAAARDLLTSPFFPGLEIPLFEIFL